jgi:hypothetical protein
MAAAPKKKRPISPEAAKILEQYRNAGKPQPGATGTGGTLPDGEGGSGQRTAPPPSAAQQRRSGTRGK